MDEHTEEYDGKIKEWSVIFTPEHKCLCGEYITEDGYYNKTDTSDKKCDDCYGQLLYNNKKLYTSHVTKRVKINSNYLCSVTSSDMCLHSFPCQHYIRIQLSNFYSEDDKTKHEKYGKQTDSTYYEHRVSYPVDGVKILKLLLLTGEDTVHFLQYSSKVPIVKPGDKIKLDGVTIVVNRSFVDPRQ